MEQKQVISAPKFNSSKTVSYILLIPTVSEEYSSLAQKHDDKHYQQSNIEAIQLLKRKKPHDLV